jgi:uncharacterized membrane protein YkvA (DUF1232 family)
LVSGQWSVIAVSQGQLAPTTEHRKLLSEFTIQPILAKLAQTSAILYTLRKRDKHKMSEPKTKLKRREKFELKGRMKSFIMFLPNMVLLLGRLLKDARVPIAEKALFVAAIVYVISPLDFIPDVFPFIGQVDDIYVVSLVLLRLLNRTDENIIREHWSGGGDIVSLANSIASIAPKFLPKRVSRVLESRVELGNAGKIIRGIKNRNEPVLVEIQVEDSPKKIKVDSRSTMTN